MAIQWSQILCVLSVSSPPYSLTYGSLLEEGDSTSELLKSVASAVRE